jgi:hypothetical protein
MESEACDVKNLVTSLDRTVGDGNMGFEFIDMVDQCRADLKHAGMSHSEREAKLFEILGNVQKTEQKNKGFDLETIEFDPDGNVHMKLNGNTGKIAG